MTLSFSDPEDVGGTRLNPKDIYGHLLLVWAVDYIPHSPTRFSRPDRPSDAIVVDVVDLDLGDEHGRPGCLARRTWWRQAQLIQSLRAKIGDKSPILAMMNRGAASAGQQAPFQLVNMKADPQAVSRANAWAAANPGFTPSLPGSRPELPPVVDPWAQPQQPQPQQQLPPPRPVTPQELSVLERMARMAQQPQNVQDQGPIPF